MPADAAPLWTDQDFLATVQYASDGNLAARQAIYGYQRPPLDFPAAVLGLASLTGSEVVADVGCGNGAYLAELARRGHRGEALGVDMSPGMLAAAARRAPGARLLAGDAGALPLRDGAADLVLAMHMLYHVPDPARAVAELRRVTRPGGLVLVGLNGEDHLIELRELIGDCCLDAGGDWAPPPGERIMLDQGQALLAGFFGSVVRRDFAGELALPDEQPVLAYARSMIVSPSPAGLDRLADAVRARIRSAPGGAFLVRTHAGCLACT